ncbi:hypothetical protein ONZ51_g8517 [Trametes cubensis]|uniref:Origin recognition complex subunit 3 n=1 Tax=Trametes cubensis TaxID=1111947 RepID=A0AAD7TN34_9APHY|nr:hypothetical protein ONZ51_g8517 [Trametes cubensis]
MMEVDDTYQKDLDDASKTCVYIPPRKPRGKAREERLNGDRTHSQVDEYELRMRAYRAAWGRCLNRVQSILRRLQAPVVEEVTTKVTRAYVDVLPGLPYPELPVIALHGANSSLVGDIASRLEHGEAAPQNGTRDSTHSAAPASLQVHLDPAECGSVMNMMKGIVTGFVDRAPSVKRKPTASLANFDINLLRVWHAAQEERPGLVVFLHDFEKFDVHVVQDVFYICSMHVPQLPLVFILLMASPPVPSFLHSAYARSTLALLRIHPVVASSGVAMVKEVLTKTLFDPDFDPYIVLGPSMLEYITDFVMRHSASPDVLVSLLQLAYMKHFTHPLSLLALDHHITHVLTSETLTASPELRPLVEALQVRLLTATSGEAQARSRPTTPTSPRRLNFVSRGAKTTTGSAHDLLECVSDARLEFHRHARRMRVAYRIATIAERVALGDSQGNSGRSAEGGGRLDNLEALSAVLRGRASSQVRYVCMAVKKLPIPKLRTLLQQLHAFLWELDSSEVKRDEEEARVFIVAKLNQLPPESEDPEAGDDQLPVPQTPVVKQLATDLSDWLQTYIEERLVRLDEQTLWDIWYTGNTPFPSELINPAPRPTVVAALLHPYDFAHAHAELVRATTDASAPGNESTVHMGEGPPHEPELWELPDTSIAFRRYVEAGRMVNVYDWFESFAVVLETQRKKIRKRAKRAEQPPLRANGKHTAQKGRARSRSNSRAGMEVDQDQDMNDDDEEEDDDMDEEEEERWKVEVQARFIRALHELDYMGFVKHTGRKPDHVIRTIYDVPD